MKKILLLCVLIVGTILAQDQVESFTAYELRIIDNSTNEIVNIITTNLTIQVTDEVMTVIGKSAMSWRLSGPIYNSSETSFYSYATDQDGIKCRVWFKVYDDHCAFGIEYSDFSFLYSCYLPGR